MNIRLNHIQHIGIPVTDLGRSKAFYARFGFAPVMESPFGHEDGEGTCVMMQNGSILMELYRFPEAALDAIRERSDGHVDHVAFDVSDIDTTFSEVKKAGFEPLEKEPVFLPFWKNGCKYFNITGPDGERLEFNQLL
ncbi:MAG: VOC family protein [Mucilaginibacter polytrichastri]|nr:VOC family protein [Mucilaginibacter polytrichastri]